MAYRRQPIFPEQIYHLYNRSVAGEPFFRDLRDHPRFIDLIGYYRFSSPGMRYSYYNRLPISERNKLIENLKRSGRKLIAIYAFCLMPNHFHFLIKELMEGGIRKFAATLQNSYAKYFNTKNRRAGSLFQEMFKAVRIETDEQFIHVARYIHLNPYSSHLARNINELKNYQWSSLPDYLEEANYYNFLDKDFLGGFFSTTEKFVSFTFDQADYQRKLQEIKHLAME